MAEIHKHSIVYNKGMANPELVLKQVTEQLSSRREVSKIKHIWDGNILFLKLLVNNELYKSKITITDSSIDIEYVGFYTDDLIGAIEISTFDNDNSMWGYN